MKHHHKFGVLAGAIAASMGLLFHPVSARAQAPASIAGDSFLVDITSGAYPLASYGYFLLLPADAGNSYRIIGIYEAEDDSGTYSYAQTGATTAQMNMQNESSGGGVVTLSLNTANSGSYSYASTTYSGAQQSGTFLGALGTAPSSVADKVISCTITDGLYPHAHSGSFTLYTAAAGNTYTIVGSGGVSSSTGTFSYGIVNRSTAAIYLYDSVTGASTIYVGFVDAASGGYATKSQMGGFQIGNFQMRDNTPPTVAITSPVEGQRWKSPVFTVTGTARDDDRVSAVRYQLNGTTWKMATTANNWLTWTADVELVPGTNVVRAYAVDSSGKNSLFATRSLFCVVKETLGVETTGRGSVTPNLDGSQLDVNRGYTIKASGSNGFVFKKWTSNQGLVSKTPTLTFLMRPGLVLTANFVDGQRPTVAMGWPTNNLYVSNALCAVRGKASDNVAVTNVWVKRAGAAWTEVDSANAYTNWTTQVALNPGTNRLWYYAQDSAGLCSVTSGVSVIYVPSAILVVRTNGQGKINPIYSGGLLALDRRYQLTATAKAGYVLTNWTDGAGLVLTNGPVCQFTMRSGLVLQANFVPDPYPTATGLYHGFFHPEPAAQWGATNCGYVAMALLDPQGGYSGRLVLEGTNLPFSGKLNLGLKQKISVPRPGKPALTVNLQWVQGLVTGSVACAQWTAELRALRMVTNHCGYAGAYTLLVPGDDQGQAPLGEGAASVSVSAAGVVQLSGKLADRGVLSQAGRVSAEGLWPLYAAPYGGRGVFWGWVQLPTAEQIMSENESFWLKPRRVAGDPYCPNGFAVMPQLLVARYAMPKPGQNVVNWTNGTLVLRWGNLAGPLTNDIVVSNNLARVVKGKISGLSLSVNRTNGLFGGSFTHPVSKKAVNFSGALVPATALGNAYGQGWFVGTNQGGEVELDRK